MKAVKSNRYLNIRGDHYYFRRAVPPFARHLFGKGEVVVSFGDVSLREARQLWARELANFDATLAACTISPAATLVAIGSAVRTPSKLEMDAQVRRWLEARMTRTFVGDVWSAAKVEEAHRRLLDLDVHSTIVASGIAIGSQGPSLATTWIVETIIEDNHWQVSPGTELYNHLLRTVVRGQVEADKQQAQDIRGEPRKIDDATFASDQYRLDQDRSSISTSNRAVSLHDLFTWYVAERKPAPATVKAWKRHIEAFALFLGHDNALKVKMSDVVGWKEQLLHRPNAAGRTLSAKTVGHTYLSALKTVFSFGLENGKITENPAATVRVRGEKKQRLRERGLNDAEARLILLATLNDVPRGLSTERALARRWVPWLCAYTGARVNEITQLRAEDIVQVRGIWTVRLTPEAGSIKDNSARDFALHPHLVEQGFPAIAAKLTGPMFYDPKRHKGGSDGHPQYKKVGEHLADWVRNTVGVNDGNVQPNHGWRHRFKTQARLADMDNEVRDVIQGHAPRSIGEGYGDTFPEVSLRELKKLARYNVDTDKRSVQPGAG